MNTLTLKDPTEVPIDVLFEIKYHTKDFKVKLNDEENPIECKDYRVEYEGNIVLCRFDDDENLTHILFEDSSNPTNILSLIDDQFRLEFVEEEYNKMWLE